MVREPDLWQTGLACGEVEAVGPAGLKGIADQRRVFQSWVLIQETAKLGSLRFDRDPPAVFVGRGPVGLHLKLEEVSDQDRKSRGELAPFQPSQRPDLLGQVLEIELTGGAGLAVPWRVQGRNLSSSRSSSVR